MKRKKAQKNNKVKKSNLLKNTVLKILIYLHFTVRRGDR